MNEQDRYSELARLANQIDRAQRQGVLDEERQQVLLEQILKELGLTRVQWISLLGLP